MEFRGFGKNRYTPDWKNEDVPLDDGSLNNHPLLDEEITQRTIQAGEITFESVQQLLGGDKVLAERVEGVVIPPEPAPKVRISGDEAAQIIRTIQQVCRDLGFEQIRLDRWIHPNGATAEIRYVHGEVQIVRFGGSPVKIWWADQPYIQRVTTALGDLIQVNR